MFVWFQCWKVRSGLWPSLPRCNFVLNQEVSDTVDLHLATTLAKLNLSLGELQALKVLTTLQFFNEMGPQKPALGYTCQCVKLIRRHLTVLDITFTPQAVLGAPVSTWSRSTSLETDVSLVISPPCHQVLDPLEICLNAKWIWRGLCLMCGKWVSIKKYDRRKMDCKAMSKNLPKNSDWKSVELDESSEWKRH